jgi:hypothetical protein
MSARLQAAFPGLRTTPYRVTSPAEPAYNCIAWAAGATTDWWWPIDDVRKSFWPSGVPRETTLDAFTAAFRSLGYIAGADDGLEPGFEKVALFADRAAVPTHAARQLPNGRWTSKLGQAEDIEHGLRALEGDIYGSVVAIFRRPAPPAV